jgi:hypothetical protein
MHQNEVAAPHHHDAAHSRPGPHPRCSDRSIDVNSSPASLLKLGNSVGMRQHSIMIVVCSQALTPISARNVSHRGWKDLRHLPESVQRRLHRDNVPVGTEPRDHSFHHRREP